MKKIFLLFICVVLLCINGKTQQISYGKIALYDSSEVVRVAPPVSNEKDFNVLLSKTIAPKWFASQYEGFVDTSLDNSYRKINDSTYEILVNNPLKNIYLVDYGVFGNNDTRMLGDFSNESHSDYELDYFDGKQTIRYGTYDYNPFFFEYSQDKVLNQQPQVGRKFLFKYRFPKPILTLTTTNDSLIKQKKKFPSISFVNLIYKEDLYKTDSLFSQKNNSILFIFQHYGRIARKGINDYLKYRLDDDSDWSFTALSYSPSILLENLSSGKHTLYVAYNVMKGEDADVLEYHFNIAPN